MPTSAARRCAAVSACRRGLLGPRLLRRAGTQTDHLRRRGAADRLGSRPDQRDRRDRLADLELPRRQRGRELPLAADQLEARTTLHRPPRPRQGRRAAQPRRPRVALLGDRQQRRGTLRRRARALAPRESEPRKPDQRSKARTRARQPPLQELPRQLGLPALHPARLQPARLAEAARATQARAHQLREAPPLPLHRSRRHGRPHWTASPPAPLGRLPAPRRVRRHAATHPWPRPRARLSLRSTLQLETTARPLAQPSLRPTTETSNRAATPLTSSSAPSRPPTQSKSPPARGINRLPQDPGSYSYSYSYNCQRLSRRS